MDEINSARQRSDKLQEQLLAAPVVELAGIVSSSGVGAGSFPGEALWSLSFSFKIWRMKGEPIHTDSLTIRRRVTDNELREIQTVIKAETVVRIRARIAEDNVFGSPQAYLEEYIGRDDDPELQQQLEELQKPKTFEAAPFGTFELDRRLGWFAADVEWVGGEIELNLKTEDPVESESCLKIAQELWSQAVNWNSRINDYAVQELLSLKNDAWLGEEETEFSPQQFISKLTLQSISIDPGGEFEFWYDDGDLFWGHSILVSGDIERGPTDAGIHG
jgi:hypothetical protein